MLSFIAALLIPINIMLNEPLEVAAEFWYAARTGDTSRVEGQTYNVATDPFRGKLFCEVTEVIDQAVDYRGIPAAFLAVNCPGVGSGYTVIYKKASNEEV